MKKIMMMVLMFLVSAPLLFAQMSTQDIARLNSEIKAGVTLWKSGNQAETVVVFKALLDKYPTMPASTKVLVNNTLGQSLALQHKFDESLVYYKDTTNLYSVLPASTVSGNNAMLGRIYLALNRYDDAMPMIFLPELKGLQFVSIFKDKIKLEAPKAVKAKFIADGISFIDADGKKVLEAKIAKVATALNAPCMEGIEEALSDIGISVKTVDRTAFKAYASDLFKQIKLAQVDPSVANVSTTMSLYMGVEEWNKFVKSYNGK